MSTLPRNSQEPRAVEAQAGEEAPQSRMTQTPRERAALMVYKALQMSGKTDSEIARALGMSQGNLTKYVKGYRAMQIDTLFRIVEACGLEIVELRVRKRQ
ncbi:MAG TPA: helix-turn-helix transcriptional regulator [Terriglobales bacterium]|nr:helix-turn-helix transcriptional regulator [Terriglobales bacterium]